jgi:hypothetical protein
VPHDLSGRNNKLHLRNRPLGRRGRIRVKNEKLRTASYLFDCRHLHPAAFARIALPNDVGQKEADNNVEAGLLVANVKAELRRVQFFNNLEQLSKTAGWHWEFYSSVDFSFAEIACNIHDKRRRHGLLLVW